jgi:hypothetical protein
MRSWHLFVSGTKDSRCALSRSVRRRRCLSLCVAGAQPPRRLLPGVAAVKTAQTRQPVELGVRRCSIFRRPTLRRVPQVRVAAANPHAAFEVAGLETESRLGLHGQERGNPRHGRGHGLMDHRASPRPYPGTRAWEWWRSTRGGGIHAPTPDLRSRNSRRLAYAAPLLLRTRARSASTVIAAT